MPIAGNGVCSSVTGATIGPSGRGSAEPSSPDQRPADTNADGDASIENAVFAPRAMAIRTCSNEASEKGGRSERPTRSPTARAPPHAIAADADHVSLAHLLM